MAVTVEGWVPAIVLREDGATRLATMAGLMVGVVVGGWP
jgi:hypothetical protein